MKVLSIAKQIQLLKDKNIIITDDCIAEKFISNNLYSRIIRYIYLLQSPNNTENQSNQLQTSITFDALVNIYTLDKTLRGLFINALEEIEISFKAKIFQFVCEKYDDPLWIYKPSMYRVLLDEEKDNHITPATKIIQDLQKTKIYKNNQYIVQYVAKHDKPIPSWMIAEILTLGTFSKIFDQLNFKKLNKNIHFHRYIYEATGLHISQFRSILQGLTDLRNKCAHHDRIVGVPLTSLSLPKKQFPNIYNTEHRLCVAIYIVNNILNHIRPRNHWCQKILKLIDEHKTTLKNDEVLGLDAIKEDLTYFGYKKCSCGTIISDSTANFCIECGKQLN